MRLLAISLFCLVAATSCLADVVTGSIAGANYAIDVPKDWNGVLVLRAHGLRSDKSTKLTADLGEHKALTDEGWMVAATSYRRNGWIIDDAIEDINNLRNHISSEYGEPSMVLLEGMSMGGLIVTIMAERGLKGYDGCVAIDPVLGLATAISNPPPVICFPRRPVLFLVNRSEIADPTVYVRKAQRAPVPPALWRVNRDGHCNVNDKERFAALEALQHWVQTGEINRLRDATQ